MPFFCFADPSCFLRVTLTDCSQPTLATSEMERNASVMFTKLLVRYRKQHADTRRHHFSTGTCFTRTR